MGLTLVTPASDPLVSVAEAVAWFKGDESVTPGETSLIETLIAAATAGAEQFLGRSIMAQTWRLSLDGFADSIELPRGPVQSITAITYDDADGDAQTLDAAYYTLDLASNPQWVVRNTDYSWPELLDGVNTVRIDFVAGYAATDPRRAMIKQAVLNAVAYWYDNRADTAFPGVAKDAIRPLRMPVL